MQVTGKDWYRAGYNDGRNGNPKWAPTDRDSRSQYLAGYLEGRMVLRTQSEA